MVARALIGNVVGLPFLHPGEINSTNDFAITYSGKGGMRIVW